MHTMMKEKGEFGKGMHPKMNNGQNRERNSILKEFHELKAN
jgi:hypothetical protein